MSNAKSLQIECTAFSISKPNVKLQKSFVDLSVLTFGPLFPYNPPSQRLHRSPPPHLIPPPPTWPSTTPLPPPTSQHPPPLNHPTRSDSGYVGGGGGGELVQVWNEGGKGTKLITIEFYFQCLQKWKKSILMD